MEKQDMKNMVVLKDLPSNIVDEAIVILKPNIKIKSLDVIDKNNKKPKKENSKKYIINEAEMLISNYIYKLENGKNKNIKINKKIEKKYKRLKVVSVALGIITLALLFVR